MSSLPQTHNALSRAERSRLVRSNRKLQALLGETPQVIEAAVSQSRLGPAHAPASTESERDSSPVPPSPSPIAHPSSLTAPQSSFTARRHMAPTDASDPGRPRLFLHLEPPSAAALTHKHTLSSSLSLPSPSTPCTPLSPTTNTASSTPSRELGPSTKDLRRRHAAKLARTLGENIAPELVSEPALRPSLLCAASTAPGLARPSLFRAASTGRSVRAERERPTVLSLFSPTPTEGADAATVSLPALGRTSPRRAGKGTTIKRSFSTATRTPLAHSRKMHRRGGSESLASEALEKDAHEMAAGVQILTAVRLDLQSGKRRKEKEWSGEWNREMEAVARRLRSLK
ncbi:hypothetical protein DFH06DRAFT_1446427 [Mycena polygramma]|nr:hypothetical protein DFH06DRAFT_1446427 [Mycena polygramma]